MANNLFRSNAATVDGGAQLILLEYTAPVPLKAYINQVSIDLNPASDFPYIVFNWYIDGQLIPELSRINSQITQSYYPLALGYRVSRWIAVQGTAFGEPTFQGALALSGGGTTAPATITDRITGGTLVALAHHRFAGRWSWSAGAGVAVTRDSESGSITVNGVTHTVPAAVTTRVSPAVSASISYALTRRWSVGASYVEITSVGSRGQQYTAGPLGLATLTGTYRF